MPPYRRQHFVPCSYLANFAAVRNPDLRTSRIWAFDGQNCRNVTVESQAAEPYLYSREDPQGAERYLHGTFEHDYPEIAAKIIGREQIGDGECFRMLIFMLSMYARSPDFDVRDGAERIRSVSDIVGSLVNTVVPVREEDYSADSDYPQRLLAKFSMAVVRLTGSDTIWTSDNPCVPMEDGVNGVVAAVLFMAIDPRTIVVFFRNDLYRRRADASSDGRDMRLFAMQIRDRRIRWIYHHSDLSNWRRIDLELPRATYVQQYVDAQRVGYSMPILRDPLSFLERI